MLKPLVHPVTFSPDLPLLLSGAVDAAVANIEAATQEAEGESSSTTSQRLVDVARDELARLVEAGAMPGWRLCDFRGRSRFDRGRPHSFLIQPAGVLLEVVMLHPTRSACPDSGVALRTNANMTSPHHRAHQVLRGVGTRVDLFADKLVVLGLLKTEQRDPSHRRTGLAVQDVFLGAAARVSKHGDIRHWLPGSGYIRGADAAPHPAGVPRIL